MHSYGKEVITLGLLWMNYYDGIKEGDGIRIMRIWKYLMLIFQQTNHRNYAKEAALLLINYHFATSERVATQLATSRFVNTKGRTGCNIPCDLHLEHLNRRLKGTICRMESNIKPSIIQTAAKAIGVVDEICKSFHDELSIAIASDVHRKPIKPSYEKDLNKVLDVLREKKIFDFTAGRRHAFISKTNSVSVLGSVDRESIQEWIIERIVPSFI